MKRNKEAVQLPIIVTICAYLFGVVLALLIQGAFTYGVVWVFASFGVTLPYWPVFVGLILLSVFIKGLFGRKGASQ